MAPPMDDELRTVLHRRADTLMPGSDPLPGIEQRVRGLRRRRAAAGVVGTALAVVAAVTLVPALTPDRAAAPGPGEIATSTAPTPTPASSRYALDPDDPWTYRGVDLPESERDSLLAEWQAVHPDGTVVPLFGQVWEPSQRLEVLFADPRTELYGYAQASESGWRFRELPLPEPALALPMVVGGDETLRAVLVASPEVTRVDYAPDGSVFQEAFALTDGVATFAVEQAPGTSDLFQAIGPDGELVLQRGVADEPAPETAPDPAPDPVEVGAPANVVDWLTRDVLDGAIVVEAREVYAQTRQAPVADVRQRALFAADDDAGRRFLLGQFWLEGDAARGTPADTFAVVLAPGQDPEPQLYRPLTRDSEVAVMFLSPPNELSRGELVVVPVPGTGQVLYGADEASEFVPKDTTGLDGVVLLTRSPQAERGEATDLLRLLDGDGRLIGTYEVPDLLCGRTSCG